MSTATGHVFEATFPADADAPRAGRAMLAEFTEDLGGDLTFRLALLLSDAVTNRVLDQIAAGHPGRVHIAFAIADLRVHGSVSDGESPDGARTNGSGSTAMREIEAGMMGSLADAWGSSKNADGRVTIWFEIDRGAALSSADYAERFQATLAARRNGSGTAA